MRELALADGFRMIAVCVDDDDDVSIKKEVVPYLENRACRPRTPLFSAYRRKLPAGMMPRETFPEVPFQYFGLCIEETLRIAPSFHSLCIASGRRTTALPDGAIE